MRYITRCILHKELRDERVTESYELFLRIGRLFKFLYISPAIKHDDPDITNNNA